MWIILKKSVETQHFVIIFHKPNSVSPESPLKKTFSFVFDNLVLFITVFILDRYRFCGGPLSTASRVLFKDSNKVNSLNLWMTKNVFLNNVLLNLNFSFLWSNSETFIVTSRPKPTVFKKLIQKRLSCHLHNERPSALVISLR